MNHVYFKILAKFDFCFLLNHKNMLNRFHCKWQVRKWVLKTCDCALLRVCFVAVIMFSRPPRGLYLQFIQYLSTKLLLFGNGIYFALIYLLISNTGAKSDVCLGFQQVSASVDLDNSQIKQWMPIQSIDSKTACRLFICWFYFEIIVYIKHNVLQEDFKTIFGTKNC